jgi:alkaline phosphatase
MAGRHTFGGRVRLGMDLQPSTGSKLSQVESPLAGRPLGWQPWARTWRAARLAGLLAALLAPMAGTAQESTPLPPTSSQQSDRWFEAGRAEVERRARLLETPNTNRAKNVILFIADGNGASSNYATRLFAGQHARPPFAADRPGRRNQSELLSPLPAAGQRNHGDEHILPHELFPHFAMSKTYNTNAQTPDSAGTASALNTGVKCKSAVLGVGEGLRRGHCEDVPANMAETFAETVKAYQQKKIGVISTARLTHATPGGVYAHIEDRNVESSRPSAADEPAAAGTEAWELFHTRTDTTEASCADSKDIATQLIDAMLGGRVDIALGGGRSQFLPSTVIDEEGAAGVRVDGVDLIERFRRGGGDYVWNRAGLDALALETDASSSSGGGGGGGWGTRPVIGLFEPSHMMYDYDRNSAGAAEDDEPALWELTKAAIDYLERASGDAGYFLMVEGGRVDHSLHDGNLFRSMTDGLAYQAAVQYAADRTSDQDTLIVSTADHSHVLEMNGYCGRGSPINGLCYDVDPTGTVHLPEPVLADDGLPFTTASYLNGGGSVLGEGSPNRLDSLGRRREITSEMSTSPNYHQESLLPLGAETHSPLDVPTYARGPWSHLFTGTIEQTVIYHIMRYAAEHGELACGGSGIDLAGGECDCDGKVLDACGVCGGEGIPPEACDCVGHVLDECGVCGGYGRDVCGVCGGPGIEAGQCSCAGEEYDACGVCGGDGSACASGRGSGAVSAGFVDGSDGGDGGSLGGFGAGVVVGALLGVLGTLLCTNVLAAKRGTGRGYKPTGRGDDHEQGSFIPAAEDSD